MNQLVTQKNFILKIAFSLAMLSLVFITFLPQMVSADIVPCGNTKDSSGRIVDECSYYDLIVLVNNLIETAIKFSFPIAGIMFAWAGLILILNPDNASKRAEAKSIFKNVLIGFAIILSSWLVVSTIANTIINKEATTTNQGKSTVPIDEF